MMQQGRTPTVVRASTTRSQREDMKPDSPTKETLLYEFFVDEGARLSQRTDWFLIFHAILLEAFFSAKPEMAQGAIGVVGVVTAYIWLMTGLRQRWLSRQ